MLNKIFYLLFATDNLVLLHLEKSYFHIFQAILLENSHLLANNSQRNGICEVLYAAAWICGEFSE